MATIVLEPLDTLFFRDGTEFSSGSASQLDAGGLFPPSPSTVTGAIRAALARANGWDGRGAWGPEIAQVVGDGPWDTGALTVTGPFVVRNGEPLFPMPRHVLGRVEGGRWTPEAMLSPGDEVFCDMGRVRLPSLAEGDRWQEEPPKPGNGRWLTLEGIRAVADGRLPSASDVVDQGHLWAVERRIGIARDRDTRTAAEGMLYSALHVRLAAGVTLGALVEGVPSVWRSPGGEALILGGEARLVTWSSWEAAGSWGLSLERIGTDSRVALLVLTPFDPGEESLEPGSGIPGLDGLTLISACCDRPQTIGGWDFGIRAPLPLRPYLPPGSVLFCEVENVSSLRSSLEPSAGGTHGLLRAGRGTALGYGTMLAMEWPENTEVKR